VDHGDCGMLNMENETIDFTDHQIKGYRDSTGLEKFSITRSFKQGLGLSGNTLGLQCFVVKTKDVGI